MHQSPSGPEHVDVQLTPVVDGDGHTPYFIEEIRVLKTAGAKSDSFVGRSSAFMRVIELIQRASGFDVPVLILGESGTGKELAAKALHAAGPQRDGPFVPVECSGLPDALFESELFGHSRGAFTGADRQHTGLVEAAKQGTLFLDEIGDVPLSMQIKLLRLIESGTYRRVGETERHPLEARIVLATHRKLERGIEEGWFRPDLYYRINAFPIELPPLRERRDDLRLLVEAILSSSSCSKTVDEHAFAWLERHPLPGNVRQLRNLLERAQILADGDSIELEHFTTSPPRVGLEDPIPSKVRRLDEVEREYLRWARDHFRGERSELASKLGLSVRSLYRKLKALED